MTEAEKREWLDLGAGLGLLVPQYQNRVMSAMIKVEQGGLADDLEHITALALTKLVVYGEDEKWMHEIWGKLSKSYHATDCPVCKNLREKEKCFSRNIIQPLMKMIARSIKGVCTKIFWRE